MRAEVLAVGLSVVACSAAPAGPPRPATAAGAPAIAGATGAKASADITPPPVAPAPDPPPKGPAVRWLSRHLIVGHLPYPARRSIYELVLHDDVALLTRTDAKATTSLSLDQVDRGATWSLDKTVLYRGPRRDERGKIHLALKAEGEPDLSWSCVGKAALVASPGALRVKSPNHSECGDQGVWKPPATTKLQVLSCQPEPEPDGQPAPDATPTVFAATPGVEYVWVNDDCIIQGGGLRLVPP